MAKPERTPAQQKQDAERLARMSAPTPAQGEAGRTVATLAVMRGKGEEITLAGQTWRLAPFTFATRDAGFEALRRCPAIMLAEAMSAEDGQQVPITLLTYNFNRLTGHDGGEPGEGEEPADKEPYSEETVVRTLVTYPETMDRAQMLAMMEPVLISLRRNHPEVTAAELEGDFDLGTFVRLVRALDRQNTGLLSSFSKQGEGVG